MTRCSTCRPRTSRPRRRRCSRRSRTPGSSPAPSTSRATEAARATASGFPSSLGATAGTRPSTARAASSSSTSTSRTRRGAARRPLPHGGSVDSYAVRAGRWLVTRDGFDFLVYYLPDYDYASHAAGPGRRRSALERADAALLELAEAAGGSTSSSTATRSSSAPITGRRELGTSPVSRSVSPTSPAGAPATAFPTAPTSPSARRTGPAWSTGSRGARCLPELAERLDESRRSTSRSFARTESPWPAGSERSSASRLPTGFRLEGDSRRARPDALSRTASSGRGQRLPAPGRGRPRVGGRRLRVRRPRRTAPRRRRQPRLAPGRGLARARARLGLETALPAEPRITDLKGSRSPIWASSPAPAVAEAAHAS